MPTDTISAEQVPYLRCISPTSRLYLPYILPISPPYLRRAGGAADPKPNPNRNPSPNLTQVAQLSGFVLGQMKSAKHAMRSHTELDLAAGVLDLCLHLLQFGFTQDQEVIEQIFEHAVAI